MTCCMYTHMCPPPPPSDLLQDEVDKRVQLGSVEHVLHALHAWREWVVRARQLHVGLDVANLQAE